MKGHTSTASELIGMLDGATSFDVVVLTQHVFGPHHEIPDVVEGWVGIWWWAPLGMLGDSTVCLSAVCQELEETLHILDKVLKTKSNIRALLRSRLFGCHCGILVQGDSEGFKLVLTRYEMRLGFVFMFIFLRNA